MIKNKNKKRTRASHFQSSEDGKQEFFLCGLNIPLLIIFCKFFLPPDLNRTPLYQFLQISILATVKSINITVIIFLAFAGYFYDVIRLGEYLNPSQMLLIIKFDLFQFLGHFCLGNSFQLYLTYAAHHDLPATLQCLIKGRGAPLKI